MLDEILNIDCLDGMKKIKSGSVDLIVCDLPYGITVCSWDAVIPFPDLWAEYKLIDNFTKTLRTYKEKNHKFRNLSATFTSYGQVLGVDTYWNYRHGSESIASQRLWRVRNFF